MRTFISILFLIAFSNLYAATITAKLDVNPVLVNDTFYLTYTASGSIDDDPDFSPINNDFEILGTQQSSNMSMINGNITRSKTWTLTLIAKVTGIFTIPAISFGSDKAPKVNVVVKNIPISNTATPNQDFLLEMESSKSIGYIQEQFIITIRLLVAKNINSYQFSDLSTNNPDSLIIPLRKDQQYKTYRGSKQYIVIEKKLALFPQKAETIKIMPFIAAIGINSQTSNSRFFDPFNTRTTSKRLRSKALYLEIKPIPENFKSTNWLPSESIKLIEHWPNNKNFIAGEPITRTITFKAQGLTSSQLPEISQKAIEGLKQYPDKPELQEDKSETGINTTQKQKLALIPTQAGTYTLPGIRVPWWNTKTNKQEYVQLAERSFTVQPAISNGNIPITSTKQPVDTSAKYNASPAPLTNIKQSESNNHFWFFLSSFFIFLWLATIFLWWRSTSRQPQQKEKAAQAPQTIKNCLKNIKSACTSNNAQETKKALLEWAKSVFTEDQPNNLTEIAKHVDLPLQKSISELNAHLYRPGISEWACQDIYEQCKNFKKSKPLGSNQINTATLEPFKKK